jgi:asparagine synthase (glutamine-hydrolysing)
VCGIAGIVPLGDRPAPTEPQVRAMCDTIVHRGPDDEGIDVRDGVGLGMRRLSIIDLAGGQQPLFNEDHTVRIVFNGEIYNFPELREKLIARGHRFATATDGEVIVHLWEDHGPRFVEHLNGMFAIALHDMRQRRFVLARDRLGIKPLFYSLTEGHLVFGSEVKTLLASGLVERSLDLNGLADFMSWEYVPAPRTLFESIRKLEPGYILELDLGDSRSQTRSYWELPVPADRWGGGEVPSSADDWEDRSASSAN